MGGDFRDRLRRLRRDPPPDAAATSGERVVPLDQGDAAGLPDWFRDRLARSADEQPSAWRDRTVGAPRDLQEGSNALGCFAFRRTVFDAAAPHGDWRLGEVDHADTEAVVFLTGDERLARLEARSACYLDIETTGLSGGAGTVPFMVCLGAFTPDGGGFELWQGFLRDPSEEPAMLAEVAARVARSSGLVSFFGKSFDRHRLEDKMRMHGVAAPFSELPHLDLYHPLRRLYRAAFDDGRLQTMERGLCGVVREHDLSGAHAPAAWFDFLTGRAHLCEHVFLHNLLDVMSLVTLHAHLGRALAEERGSGQSLDRSEIAAPTASTRASALARLFVQRKAFEQGLQWCEWALERDVTVPVRRELALLRADCLRRTVRHEEALEAYRALAVERDAIGARALWEAARLTADRAALELLDRALDVARVADLRLVDRIQRRRERLVRRLEDSSARGEGR